MLGGELLLLEYVGLGIVLDRVDCEEAVLSDGHVVYADVRVGVVKAGLDATAGDTFWRVVFWTFGNLIFRYLIQACVVVVVIGSVFIEENFWLGNGF